MAGRRLRKGRLIVTLIVLGAIGIAAYASTFAFSYGNLFERTDPFVRTDVARIWEARVNRVEHARDVAQLQAILKAAVQQGLTVSISGSRHSQGGHTFVPGGVVLDMRTFNRILAIDTAALTIHVESGATWDEVQRALAPRGLAIKVMQSSNIFTVGGTMSANAHGRDIDVTQFVEVVQRFNLMLASGEVVEVSRDTNPELFSLVIGGYGMYGIILDVVLRVTRDEMFEQQAVVVDYKEFPKYFTEAQADSNVVFLLARPSIDPDPASFLREIVVATWRRAAPGTAGHFSLTEEAHVRRDRFFFGLSRKFDWAKSLRWTLQKRVEMAAGAEAPRVMSRNNSMRPPLAPLEFLAYKSDKDTDIIQEYYVPVENFVPFMDRFREILVTGRMNVLSSTVRYVTPNATPVLAYAPDKPVFAIIQMSNVGLDSASQAHTERVTQQLVDAAIEFGGTYYLTYQLYPTPEQLHRAYPNAQRAFERKRFYDPNETINSLFYMKYGRTQPR